jgi:hypothetical protein
VKNILEHIKQYNFSEKLFLSLLISSGVILTARAFHPATFSHTVLTTVLLLAFLTAGLSLYNAKSK